MNPGPTNVSETVRSALKTKDICHREPEFSEVLQRVRSNLLKVVKGEKTHTAIPFVASATGSNEAVISSIHGKILLINNGKYSERLKEIAKRYHISTKELTFHPLEQIDLKIVEDELKSDAKISHMVLVHHETTTGMLAPLRQIGRLAKKYSKTLFADTVSSVGGHEIDANLDNLSFFTVNANKCLESFPGISFVIARKKDLAALKNKSRSFYFDLCKQWEYIEEKGQTPFTPAVQLFYAADKALQELLEEGLKNRIQRYKRLKNILKIGLGKLGFRFLLPGHLQSNILLAVKLPINMDYWKVHDMLKKRCFTIYSGQNLLNQGIFRIASLGRIGEKDIRTFLIELRKILDKLGVRPIYS